ncbi:RNA polymerase sigma factor [Actinoallomurus sp. CA-150999]|uniref:RNA polymerase sigma factor n=1 Tax=Actinoallomurus sp. CA-150999 TaxID=3239887 RepID=UPI003D903B20
MKGARIAEPTAHTPDAFAALYDEHFPAIHNYVASRLGRDVADDIAADTFLIALRKRGGYDPAKGAVRPWLFGIATRLVAQHRRQEMRRYRALAKLGPEEVADSHENRVINWVRAEGLQPRLAKALAALPRGQRDVLLLSAVSGLSHEEISEALEISYGTVGSRLSRARKKVRSVLGEDNDG